MTKSNESFGQDKDLTYSEMFAAVRATLGDAESAGFRLSVEAWRHMHLAEGKQVELEWTVWHCGLQRHSKGATARACLAQVRLTVGLDQVAGSEAVAAIGECVAS